MQERQQARIFQSPIRIEGYAAMAGLDDAAVSAWLQSYGAAWEGRSAEQAAALFTEDATYRETPFAEAFRGRDAIRAYWNQVTADQSDIDFRFSVIATTAMTGVAEWSTRFRSISGDAPVELNGVFVLEFADAERVCSLREWWHVR